MTQVWDAVVIGGGPGGSAFAATFARGGCRVEEVLFEADRAVGVAFSEGGGARQEIRAEWVVDATGDDTLIGKRLGLVELDPGLGSTAVWSYWEHGSRLAGRDRGNTLYV